MRRQLWMMCAAPALVASLPHATLAQGESSVSGVTVQFGPSSLPFAGPAQMPYRSRRDNAIWVAPESLAPLGIVAKVKGAAVDLLLPDGTVLFPPTQLAPPERGGKGIFVNLLKVVEGLNSVCDYDPSTATLTIRPVITEVALFGDTVKVRSALPLSPKITQEPEKNRVVIDFPGVSIGDVPRSIPVVTQTIKAIQVAQAEPNLARVTIELKEAGVYQWAEGKPLPVATFGPAESPHLKLAQSDASAKLAALSAAASAAKPKPPVKPVATKVVPPTLFRGVRVEDLSSERLRLRLDTSQRTPTRSLLTENTLTLDFANVTLAESALSALTGISHPLVRAARLTPVGEKAARLVLDLTQSVGYSLRLSPKGGLALDVLTPRKTEGPLVGKVVVVDPGHGGHDSGTTGNGSVEKTNALAISRLLTEELINMGANVVMTRDDDSFIPVDQRPEVANQNNADFFISVHCDDGSPNRAMNGSTVYYHQFCTINKELAQFIGARLGSDVGGIRNKGISADKRFSTGYGVLRCSQMMAVLVECGFLSNASDSAQLRNPETQKKIATAIAQGIADYLAANPSANTRTVNPRPKSNDGLPPLDVTDKPTQEGGNPIQ